MVVFIEEGPEIVEEALPTLVSGGPEPGAFAPDLEAEESNTSKHHGRGRGFGNNDRYSIHVDLVDVLASIVTVRETSFRNGETNYFHISILILETG